MTEDNLTPGTIANGNPEALNFIYQRYQPDFIAWSRKQFSIERDIACEIFQESVVTLYENIINGKLVDMTSSIKTYLFAIGKNKIMEFLRRTGKHESLSGHDVESRWADQDPETSDSELMRKQKLMKACVLELGKACQEILALYYFHQQSLSEISNKLAYKNEETVKSQKFKCMQQLRKNFLSKYQGWL